MVSGVRRRARVYALQVLFALDVNPDASVEQAVINYRDWFELDVEPAAEAFARDLATQAWSQRAEIDDVIQTASRNWRLDRMSRVDRNILRLAAHELRKSPEVPARVVINEAVELAKQFGTSESPAFVNGILDKIAQQLRRSEVS
jgi:N utilization substance protein B